MCVHRIFVSFESYTTSSYSAYVQRCFMLISCRYIRNARQGKVGNFMGGKMAPFCAAGNKYLGMSSRIPGKEIDKLVSYKEENPTHSIVIR